MSTYITLLFNANLGI